MYEVGQEVEVLVGNHVLQGHIESMDNYPAHIWVRVYYPGLGMELERVCPDQIVE